MTDVPEQKVDPNKHEPLPQYLWHHKVHERWGGERLFFWRLAFSPTYDANRILDALREVLAEQNVTSYAVYETSGLYDVLLRVWMPAAVSIAAFESALERRLDTLHLRVRDHFYAGEI